MSEESRAESIFLAALKLATQERSAYLAAQCGDDQELRKRVDELLEAQEKLGSFLQQPCTPLVSFFSPNTCKKRGINK